MNYTIAAVTRTTKGPGTRLTGQLPAVVYGAGGKAESLAVGVSEFNKLYKIAGESTLVDLIINSKDIGKVIIQDVQFDPVSDRAIHADFRRIDMNKLMHAPVTLKFVGEAPVIKAQGGTLATNIQTVTVECLPKDLISHIDINIAILNSFDDVIKVKDLVLPPGIKIISPHGDDLVAKPTRALTEDELKAIEEANANADVSKIESAKPEKPVAGEEGADVVAKSGDDKSATLAADAKKDEKKK